MTLAGMLAADKDALICDLAETYGIFDMRALPVSLLATLAAGLREESRIKSKLAGLKANPDTILLASAVDCLNWLVWAKTQDAQKNRNRPASVLNIITGKTATEKDNTAQAFTTPEEFEKAWAKIGGGKHGDGTG